MGELSKKFRELCEQAAKETNSVKLLNLTQEINRLFDEREKANQALDMAKQRNDLQIG